MQGTASLFFHVCSSTGQGSPAQYTHCFHGIIIEATVLLSHFAHASHMHAPCQCRMGSTTFRYQQILVQPQTLSELLFLLTLQAEQGCNCKVSLTARNHHDFSSSLGNKFTVFVVQRRAVKYRMKYFLQYIIHFLDIMLKAPTVSLKNKTRKKPL